MADFAANSRKSGLARLLRPRSIAVVGGHSAAEVVRQSRKIGFDGSIWPVHPRHLSIEGIPAFRNVGELPGVPDAVFVGVNRYLSVEVMGELAARGVGGAVAFASGYAEAGDEGAELQAQLVAAARGMPFFGPNCYGFINYFDKSLVWPDQFGGSPVSNGAARGVAIITQSGNIGLNITMQRRALALGYLITLGNQASCGHAEVMDVVLDDPRVCAIGLHMESLGDPLELARVVARARRQGVGVVALKTGRSAHGAQIAMSHTASMASSDAVVDSYFRRIGIARVRSIPSFLEALKILHVKGALTGHSISSLSCSGGEAALIADEAGDAGLHFKPLEAEDIAAISATLPEMVSVSNPLDYHTFGWRNRDALGATFSAMMRAGADFNLLILDFPRPDTCETADWDVAASAMGDAAQEAGKPAGILATLPEAMPEAQANALIAQGIVPLFGMVEALQAIKAAADVGGFAAIDSGFDLWNKSARDDAENASEFAGKRALAKFGVKVPRGWLATSAVKAAEIANTLGFPVVVKASGAALAHKTEFGGVRLNLSTTSEVREAVDSLLLLTGEVLVEEMVRDIVAELIIGVARDAVLGLYLVLGSGGVLAELVDDSITVLLPATRTEIAGAIGELRMARLLNGYRGGKIGDIEAVIDAVMAVQEFADVHRDYLIELDINPLMVRKAGSGVVAADVLLRLASISTALPAVELQNV